MADQKQSNSRNEVRDKKNRPAKFVCLFLFGFFFFFFFFLAVEGCACAEFKVRVISKLGGGE